MDTCGDEEAAIAALTPWPFDDGKYLTKRWVVGSFWLVGLPAEPAGRARARSATAEPSGGARARSAARSARAEREEKLGENFREEGFLVGWW